MSYKTVPFVLLVFFSLAKHALWPDRDDWKAVLIAFVVTVWAVQCGKE